MNVKTAWGNLGGFFCFWDLMAPTGIVEKIR